MSGEVVNLGEYESQKEAATLAELEVNRAESILFGELATSLHRAVEAGVSRETAAGLLTTLASKVIEEGKE